MRLGSHLGFLILLLITLIFGAPACAGGRVLVLHSYHAGHPWTDSLHAGIRSVLQPKQGWNLFVEYLDVARFPDTSDQRQVLSTWVSKHAGRAYDLVIATDNAATDLLLEHRSQLAPGVPISFGGYAAWNPQRFPDLPRVYGLLEDLDFEGTLRDALHLFPRARQLLFVQSDDQLGSPWSGQGLDSLVKRLSTESDGRVVRVQQLRNPTAEELGLSLGRQSAGTLVFALGGLRSPEGRREGLDASTRTIVQLSPYPIFGLWESQLGQGILGGRILQGSEHGRKVAERGLQALGDSSHNFSIESQRASAFLYNPEVLQRMGLLLDQLPVSARMQGKPSPHGHQEGLRIAIAAGLFLFLLLLTGVLAVYANKQRQEKVRAQLRQNEQDQFVESRMQALRQRAESMKQDLLMQESLLNNALVTIMLVKNHQIQWVSRHAEELFAYSTEELQGGAWEILFPNLGEFHARTEVVEKSIQLRRSYVGDLRFRRKDGSLFWAAVSCKALVPEDLEQGVLYVLVDVDHKKQLEIYLQASNQKLRSTQDMVDRFVAMTETDLQGNITYASDAFCKLSGYCARELLGQNHRIIRHPDMPSEIFQDLWQTITQGRPWSGDVKNLRKDGSTFWASSHLLPIRGADNEIMGYRAIRIDITDRKRAEELAVTDRLTQLYNRTHLDTVLAQALAQAERYGNCFSLILLDIDKFKDVNDFWGHPVGDMVLKESAQLLRGFVRKSDTLGRWGGEEFLIVANQTPLDSAVQMAEKLRAAMANFPYTQVGRKTGSFGVSTYHPGDTIEDMVLRADEALYKAKRNGRNQVVAEQLQL